MTTSNMIFIEGKPSAQIEELARFIGELKQVEKVDEYVSQTKSARDVVKESMSGGVLAKAPEDNLEAVYNQLFGIVTDSEDVQLSAIAEEIAQNVAANTESGAGGLRVLNNLFNVLVSEKDSGSARAAVFEAMVALAARTKLLAMSIVPLVGRLPAMFGEWELAASKRVCILMEVRQALDAAQLSSEAYEAELVLLDVIDAQSDAERAAEVAASAIVRFANLSAVCDLDALASLGSVQELSKSGRLGDSGALLNALLSSDFKQWREFAAANSSMLQRLGVDADKASDKMRLLTVASVAAENLGNDVPFSTVAQAIEVDEDEVEVWVIDVIRAGLIQGKMNQVSRTVLPTRTTYRQFGAEQWKTLGEQLDKWKQSLEQLQPVITNAKLVAQQQAMQMAGQARVTIKD
ncbi:hypothetical protein IW140_005158 [Coemansia sp. RSA 1813]|nr:hypothetical protein EV178_005135 [Coemansia sp. RSA 1646]KAJ1768106.1 hypothetical protein LPJ74_005004 [Coemansia sp. RSA 1843]KAJ2088037.1 hypothetical protein IW138_004546 [Coemansia sp. RSA 986]KAJ2565875.1 hypothetical protein IW140_005158 [Coemansia sp. RSA 1813]